jgi:hypothetical protein
MYPVRPITKTILFIVACFFFCIPAFAQQNVIRGSIIDTAEKKDLHFSIVALIDHADSTLYRSVRANEKGYFEITQIPAGKYTLMISYPKMADYLQDFTITDTSKIDLKTILMVTKADLLQEVVVRAGLPIRMRGDTLEYTADSFAVKPGANVEEMLKRLPGIYVDKDGKIIAQGKEVKKILVDGDEFFSDDPSFAARYLQADAIEKVQVFDDKSEKTKFTGLDDGARTKTINLKLKKNRKNGIFGKLSTGSNGDDYFEHEAMGALFDGTRKISVFGMSARNGKQDLSQNETSQYVSQDYDVINDGTSFFMRGGGLENDNAIPSGLPSVQSGGVHYSEKWNDGKQKVFTNYRIKQVNATGWNNAILTNVLPDGSSFTNKTDSRNEGYNLTQKGSGSFSFAVDSFATIKISVNGSLGNSNGLQSTSGNSTNEKDIQVNNSQQTVGSNSTSKTFGSNISYKRRLRKQGRTLSLNVQQDYNNKQGENHNFSANNYYDATTGLFKNADTLDQLQRSSNATESYAVSLNYSDRISKTMIMDLEYGWKKNIAGNEFNTLNGAKLTERIDSLSNNYTFGATTHIAGAMLGFYRSKFMATISGKALFTGFNQMDNDLHQQSTRHFINLAPQAVFSYRPSGSRNLTFIYTGQTTQPTIDQLQPLKRSSNKLYVVIGNADLRPAFRHNADLGFGFGNWAKGNMFSANIAVNYTSNNITTSTFIDSQNRTTAKYINLNSLPGINFMTTYNWLIPKFNLRPAVSLSVNKSGNYLIQNNQKQKNESLGLNASFSLMREWKNVLTASYRGTFSNSIGWSNVAGGTNTHALLHAHNVNATIYMPWHLELGNDCIFNFQPKNASFNTSFNTVQWNAFLQKKFLKNDQAVIQLAVNDIMNNNTGYTRRIDGRNISETNRFVLKRYWMLTLTWNFSKSLK